MRKVLPFGNLLDFLRIEVVLLCRRHKKTMMAIKPKIRSATALTMMSDAVLMTLFETLYEKNNIIIYPYNISILNGFDYLYITVNFTWCCCSTIRFF
jgi:hypothetical protein